MSKILVLALLALTLGGCGVDWFPAPKASSTTTTVASFAFTNISGVQLNTAQTSNAVTVKLTSGSTAAISVSNGTYAIGSAGTFTSTSGSVKDGDTVRVQHTSGTTEGQQVSTTLTIGGQSATFSSRTVRNAVTDFSFPSKTAVTTGTVQTSAPATITINIGTSAPISVINGEYSLDGTTFVSTAGSITTGKSVIVRHTSSADAGGTVVTTLQVGNKSATFTSTTAGGTGNATVGAFNFTPQTGVGVNTAQTSNSITVALSGATTAPISVTGTAGSNFTYSIGGATPTSALGTVSNNATVTVQHTASSVDGQTVVTTLTIGDKSAVFSSTTALATVAPFAFDPAEITAAASTNQNSNQIAVSLTSGTSAPISVANGMYSINGGTFISTDGTVNNGDKVVVQNTTSALVGDSVVTTLTIGNRVATFTSITGGGTPPVYDYSFVLATGTGIGATAVSQPVAAPSAGAISITGGEYALDGGAFTSATGTVKKGQSITVRHTNASNIGQTVNTILSIGTVWKALFSTVQT